MAKKRTLYVNVSLDVEEEGLFSGTYKARDTPVYNVANLPNLAPLSRDFGLPLTLYCAWSVLSSPECRPILAKMRDEYGSEIGAHLHHWSSPPFVDAPENATPQRTDKMSRETLAQKLDSLFAEFKAATGGKPVSFRMGRWDLKRSLLPLLAERGIKADASVCPLRVFAGGPDHFLAPAKPWRVVLPGGEEMLEIPVTQIPLFPFLARLWHKAPFYRDSFHFFGALSANPFWHSPAIWRFATKLHASRGGRVLSIFWHSSEIMRGGSPKVPDQKAVDLVLRNIFAFCEWLRENFDVRGVTSADLWKLKDEFPVLDASPERDW